MLIVVILRLILGTLIFRFPLAAGILAIFLDYHDLNILMRFDPPSLKIYQQWDKILDLFYLTIEVYVALSWHNAFVRLCAGTLFMYRFIGILLFEVTGYSLLLFIFPNVFEFFYLTYLAHLKIFKKDYFSSHKIVFIIILLILLPKLAQEYFLHINLTHPWVENKYVKWLRTPYLLDF